MRNIENSEDLALVIALIAIVIVVIVSNRIDNERMQKVKPREKRENETVIPPSELYRLFSSTCSNDCFVLDLNNCNVLPAILIADYGNRMIWYAATDEDEVLTHNYAIPFDMIVDFWIERVNDHIPIQIYMLAPIMGIILGAIAGVVTYVVAPIISLFVAPIFLVAGLYLGASSYNEKREKLYERFRRTDIRIHVVTAYHSSPVVTIPITSRSVSTSATIEDIDMCCANAEALLKQILYCCKYNGYSEQSGYGYDQDIQEAPSTPQPDTAYAPSSPSRRRQHSVTSSQNSTDRQM